MLSQLEEAIATATESVGVFEERLCLVARMLVFGRSPEPETHRSMARYSAILAMILVRMHTNACAFLLQTQQLVRQTPAR